MSQKLEIDYFYLNYILVIYCKEFSAVIVGFVL